MNKLYREEDIREIASAIRAKAGTTELMKVSEMASAIDSIPSSPIPLWKVYEFTGNGTLSQSFTLPAEWEGNTTFFVSIVKKNMERASLGNALIPMGYIACNLVSNRLAYIAGRTSGITNGSLSSNAIIIEGNVLTCNMVSYPFDANSEYVAFIMPV